ncbi:Butyrophilin subfamily 3 member A2 [Dissostichus eleginoides]|uniref:Butyrophilin subfamily 3 member A2 n=1 Tax=Dissostichus eleginoides TaxID=100907 RepID=A0AAD9BWL2_DISEL|nr:Butyrophilin subfamily 3 member A2 [Dissostichus eleginoides]
MAALTSAQHAGILILLWIHGSLAAGEKVKAEPGEDVTLQCHTSTDAAITVLKWSRTELEHYVFFFRDNKPVEIFQHQRYHGRVKLNNQGMKNGDVSVLLKNVSSDDTGTYECEIITRSNNRRKRDLGDVREFVHSVHLSVSEGPKKEINDEHHQYGDANDEQPEGPRGYVGLGVGLGLVCLIIGGVVVAGLVVTSKRAKEKRSLENFDEEEVCKVNI